MLSCRASLGGRVPLPASNPVRTLPCSALSFGFQELEECRHRDDLDLLDLAKTQEILVSADKPAYSC